MSDHADTIRQTIEFISIDEAQRETVVALEALLAEAAQLRREARQLEVMNEALIDAGKEVVAELRVVGEQVVAVARIRQRCAAVDTGRGGQIGRCSEPDHSHSVQQAARTAHVQSAPGGDLADVRTCRVDVDGVDGLPA